MADNLIAEISRLGFRNLNTPPSASISDVQHLASYNWIEAPRATPTIAVPDSPALWSPPDKPFRVGKDTGHFYIAQNAARHPGSPLEPLFRALYVSHPSFDIASIDVVTDRNNIRKLLSFVNPRWGSYKREDFTIHVEVTDNTAIFCRQETKTDQYISPNEFRGYGHSFEEKCTIRQTDMLASPARSSLQPAGSQAGEINDLSSVLDSLSLSPESVLPKKSVPTSSKLVIQKEGQAVLLRSTLEVKTRVAHRPLAFEDVVSQLWVSQRPKLVRAYHTKGLFAVPEVEDVAVQVKLWEDQNQKDLRTLAGLIEKIRDIVRESGGRAVLKYNANRDNLAFYKLGGEQMLPKDLYTKWLGRGNNE